MNAMPSLENIWDHAERELIESLCRRAKVPPDVANQPFLRLSAAVREKLEMAWNEKIE